MSKMLEEATLDGGRKVFVPDVEFHSLMGWERAVEVHGWRYTRAVLDSSGDCIGWCVWPLE